MNTYRNIKFFEVPNTKQECAITANNVAVMIAATSYVSQSLQNNFICIRKSNKHIFYIILNVSVMCHE